MINVYYVGSYDDDEFGSARHFVGWSKNIMAIRMYNVAGHCTGAFYDHYNIYEYNITNHSEFIKCVKRDWDVVITDERDESYIDIHESYYGDYVSLTNREYRELILESDIEYEFALEMMKILYFYVLHDLGKIIRKRSIDYFIKYLAATYLRVLRGVSVDATKLPRNLDVIQVFLHTVKNSELSSFY